MKTLKQFFTLVTFAAAMCSNMALQAWGYYGAVLHDPKTGHIVRLLGDRHVGWPGYMAENVRESCESKFVENIVPSLDRYLKTPAQEIFLVESGQYAHKQVLGCYYLWGIFRSSLLHYLIAASVLIKHKIKNTQPFSDQFICEQPAISVVSYDLRATLKGWDFDFNGGSSFNLEGLPTYFELMNCLQKPLKYRYNSAYSALLKNMASKLKKEIDCLQSLLTSNSFRYRKAMNKKIIQDVADYGFLSSIGRACYQKRNITLYMGGDHCRKIIPELQAIGYEILWLQENKDDEPLSKEDCEKLFAIKPIPKSKL